MIPGRRIHVGGEGGEDRWPKVRGLRRHFRRIHGWPAAIPRSFDQREIRDGAWYMNLPAAEILVDGGDAPDRIRRECMIQLLDAGRALRECHPVLRSPARILLALSFPNFFNSSIDVFLNDEAFETFHDRIRSQGECVELAESGSPLRRWNLDATGLRQSGYRLIMEDPLDVPHRRDCWLVEIL